MRIESLRSVGDKLNSDDYTCHNAARDCPFCFFNSCPLCVCGLMPVLVVCVSAILHKDYVTHVTDFGAALVGEMGLSYTVHYSSSCHPMIPQEDPDEKRQILPAACNPDYGFEVTAAEYDAISGSIMRLRNITDVRAKTLTAVKVTPDWRFVIFSGSVQQDPSVQTPEMNLWVVGSTETKAQHVAPIFSSDQILALEAQCTEQADRIYTEALSQKTVRLQEEEREAQRRDTEKAKVAELARLTEEVRKDKEIALKATKLAKAAELAATAEATTQAPEPAENGKREHPKGWEADQEQRSRKLQGKPAARVLGFKNLQVILQPLVTVEHDGDIVEAKEFTEGSGEGPVYRLAMAVKCEADIASLASQGASTTAPLKFSHLAIVDFELLGFNKTNVGSVNSALLPLNFTLHLPQEEPTSAGIQEPAPVGAEATSSFDSHACPRFIPSTRGSRLLFVAEHERIPLETSSESQLPFLLRRLAVANVVTGNVIKSDASFQASWLSGLTGGLLRGSTPRNQNALLVNIGMNSLPDAPVHGCPEFVPSLYVTPKSITDAMMEHFRKIRDKLLKGDEIKETPKQLEKYNMRDTFVFTSNTIGSATVLGVDAQVLAASLDNGGAGGQVSNAKLLYNVDAIADSITSGLNQLPPSWRKDMNEEKRLLRLEGCKPIRAAGRKGHMNLEWAFETLLTTLHVHTESKGYTTWLACTTADQKVAIVQSPRREHWVNFSMPFPVYRADSISQNVWCPRGSEDECFEVWSSPNPNEMAT